MYRKTLRNFLNFLARRPSSFSCEKQFYLLLFKRFCLLVGLSLFTIGGLVTCDGAKQSVNTSADSSSSAPETNILTPASTSANTEDNESGSISGNLPAAGVIRSAYKSNINPATSTGPESRVRSLVEYSASADLTSCPSDSHRLFTGLQNSSLTSQAIYQYCRGCDYRTGFQKTAAGNCVFNRCVATTGCFSSQTGTCSAGIPGLKETTYDLSQLATSGIIGTTTAAMFCNYNTCTSSPKMSLANNQYADDLRFVCECNTKDSHKSGLNCQYCQKDYLASGDTKTLFVDGLNIAAVTACITATNQVSFKDTSNNNSESSTGLICSGHGDANVAVDAQLEEGITSGFSLESGVNSGVFMGLRKACDCTSGYTGVYCDKCFVGYLYDDAMLYAPGASPYPASASSTASAPFACLHTTCVSALGANSGVECTRPTTKSAAGANAPLMVCNDHGTANTGILDVAGLTVKGGVNTACSCDAGFAGRYCHQCANGYLRTSAVSQTLPEQLLCSNYTCGVAPSDTDSETVLTGAFSGKRCAERAADLPTGAGFPPTFTGPCNGRGRANSGGGINRVCDCDPEYVGRYCEYCAKDHIASGAPIPGNATANNSYLGVVPRCISAAARIYTALSDAVGTMKICSARGVANTGIIATVDGSPHTGGTSPRCDCVTGGFTLGSGGNNFDRVAHYNGEYCQYAPMRVFVTHNKYAGDLSRSDTSNNQEVGVTLLSQPVLGNARGADGLCQAIADINRISGRWTAWLNNAEATDNASTPDEYFRNYLPNLYSVLVNVTLGNGEPKLIFRRGYFPISNVSDKLKFFTGTLDEVFSQNILWMLNPIKTELKSNNDNDNNLVGGIYEVSLSSSEDDLIVWTGTRGSDNRRPGQNLNPDTCNNWTSRSSATSGILGLIADPENTDDSIDSRWTEAGSNVNHGCNRQARLYCLENMPPCGYGRQWGGPLTGCVPATGKVAKQLIPADKLNSAALLQHPDNPANICRYAFNGVTNAGVPTAFNYHVPSSALYAPYLNYLGVDHNNPCVQQNSGTIYNPAFSPDKIVECKVLTGTPGNDNSFYTDYTQDPPIYPGNPNFYDNGAIYQCVGAAGSVGTGVNHPCPAGQKGRNCHFCDDDNHYELNPNTHRSCQCETGYAPHTGGSVLAYTCNKCKSGYLASDRDAGMTVAEKGVSVGNPFICRVATCGSGLVDGQDCASLNAACNSHGLANAPNRSTPTATANIDNNSVTIPVGFRSYCDCEPGYTGRYCGYCTTGYLARGIVASGYNSGAVQKCVPSFSTASVPAGNSPPNYTQECNGQGTANSGADTQLGSVIDFVPGEQAVSNSGVVIGQKSSCDCRGNYAGAYCQYPPIHAFVTSRTFSGRLDRLGYARGADALCQEAANSAGLGGRWVALVSDTTPNGDARQRLQVNQDSRIVAIEVTGADGSYEEKELIAYSIKDILTSGAAKAQFQHAIFRTEVWTGAANSSSPAKLDSGALIWTGLTAEGTPETGSVNADCQNWSTTSGSAYYGRYDGTQNNPLTGDSYTLIHAEGSQSCTTAAHIYCIENRPSCGYGLGPAIAPKSSGENNYCTQSASADYGICGGANNANYKNPCMNTTCQAITAGLPAGPVAMHRYTCALNLTNLALAGQIGSGGFATGLHYANYAKCDESTHMEVPPAGGNQCVCKAGYKSVMQSKFSLDEARASDLPDSLANGSYRYTCNACAEGYLANGVNGSLTSGTNIRCNDATCGPGVVGGFPGAVCNDLYTVRNYVQGVDKTLDLTCNGHGLANHDNTDNSLTFTEPTSVVVGQRTSCDCYTGYIGKYCEFCAPGYLRDYTQSNDGYIDAARTVVGACVPANLVIGTQAIQGAVSGGQCSGYGTANRPPNDLASKRGTLTSTDTLANTGVPLGYRAYCDCYGENYPKSPDQDVPNYQGWYYNGDYCQYPPLKIFVSSGAYLGDLSDALPQLNALNPTSGVLLGAKGADGLCQGLVKYNTEARAILGTGRFNAWLSDQYRVVNTATGRLLGFMPHDDLFVSDALPIPVERYSPKVVQIYKDVNDDNTLKPWLIADNLSALLSGNLQHYIRYTEVGELLAGLNTATNSAAIWTGTDTAGNAAVDNATCQHWTQALGSTSGQIGLTFGDASLLTSAVGATWTSAALLGCDQGAHLYCLENRDICPYGQKLNSYNLCEPLKDITDKGMCVSTGVAAQKPCLEIKVSAYTNLNSATITCTSSISEEYLCKGKNVTGSRLGLRGMNSWCPSGRMGPNCERCDTPNNWVLDDTHTNCTVKDGYACDATGFCNLCSSGAISNGRTKGGDDGIKCSRDTCGSYLLHGGADKVGALPCTGLTPLSGLAGACNGRGIVNNSSLTGYNLNPLNNPNGVLTSAGLRAYCDCAVGYAGKFCEVCAPGYLAADLSTAGVVSGVVKNCIPAFPLTELSTDTTHSCNGRGVANGDIIDVGLAFPTSLTMFTGNYQAGNLNTSALTQSIFNDNSCILDTALTTSVILSTPITCGLPASTMLSKVLPAELGKDNPPPSCVSQLKETHTGSLTVTCNDNTQKTIPYSLSGAVFSAALYAPKDDLFLYQSFGGTVSQAVFKVEVSSGANVASAAVSLASGQVVFTGGVADLLSTLRPGYRTTCDCVTTGDYAYYGGRYCQYPPLRAFVTNDTYRGDLTNQVRTAGVLYGAQGADGICQAAALSAGLNGRWRAWLSDANSPATGRLRNVKSKIITLPVPVLDNPYLVADNLASLLQRPYQLKHSINITEFKGDVSNSSPVFVWTATQSSGAALTAPEVNCQNWTTGSTSATGRVGNLTTTATWTDSNSQHCGIQARLYCFEDKPPCGYGFKPDQTDGTDMRCLPENQGDDYGGSGVLGPQNICGYESSDPLAEVDGAIQGSCLAPNSQCLRINTNSSAVISAALAGNSPTEGQYQQGFYVCAGTGTLTSGTTSHPCPAGYAGANCEQCDTQNHYTFTALNAALGVYTGCTCQKGYRDTPDDSYSSYYHTCNRCAADYLKIATSGSGSQISCALATSSICTTPCCGDHGSANSNTASLDDSATSAANYQLISSDTDLGYRTDCNCRYNFKGRYCDTCNTGYSWTGALTLTAGPKIDCETCSSGYINTGSPDAGTGNLRCSKRTCGAGGFNSEDGYLEYPGDCTGNNTCNNHGVVNATSTGGRQNACVCNVSPGGAAYTGSYCQNCGSGSLASGIINISAGYIAGSCNPVAAELSQCSDHAASSPNAGIHGGIDQHCNCDLGYAGNSCELCADQYAYQENPPASVSTKAFICVPEDIYCNYNGTVQQPLTNGVRAGKNATCKCNNLAYGTHCRGCKDGALCQDTYIVGTKTNYFKYDGLSQGQSCAAPVTATTTTGKDYVVNSGFCSRKGLTGTGAYVYTGITQLSYTQQVECFAAIDEKGCNSHGTVPNNDDTDADSETCINACTCYPGYMGLRCDYCQNDYLYNSGTHTCSAAINPIYPDSAVCMGTGTANKDTPLNTSTVVGRRTTCDCTSGYAGKYCEQCSSGRLLYYKPTSDETQLTNPISCVPAMAACYNHVNSNFPSALAHTKTTCDCNANATVTVSGYVFTSPVMLSGANFTAITVLNADFSQVAGASPAQYKLTSGNIPSGSVLTSGWVGSDLVTGAVVLNTGILTSSAGVTLNNDALKNGTTFTNVTLTGVTVRNVILSGTLVQYSATGVTGAYCNYCAKDYLLDPIIYNYTRDYLPDTDIGKPGNQQIIQCVSAKATNGPGSGLVCNGRGSANNGQLGSLYISGAANPDSDLDNGMLIGQKMYCTCNAPYTHDAGSYGCEVCAPGYLALMGTGINAGTVTACISATYGGQVCNGHGGANSGVVGTDPEGRGLIGKRTVCDCQDNYSGQYCQYSPLRMFVTSTTYQGDLGGIIGGAKGADTLCQEAAKNSNLSPLGRWSALLVDNLGNGSSVLLGTGGKFLNTTSKVVNVSYDLVANNLVELLQDHNVKYANLKTEAGAKPSPGEVWTGLSVTASSTTSGPAGAYTCTNWTSNYWSTATETSADTQGLIGKIYPDATKFTLTESYDHCDHQAYLYCVENKPACGYGYTTGKDGTCVLDTNSSICNYNYNPCIKRSISSSANAADSTCAPSGDSYSCKCPADRDTNSDTSGTYNCARCNDSSYFAAKISSGGTAYYCGCGSNMVMRPKSGGSLQCVPNDCAITTTWDDIPGCDAYLTNDYAASGCVVSGGRSNLCSGGTCQQKPSSTEAQIVNCSDCENTANRASISYNSTNSTLKRCGSCLSGYYNASTDDLRCNACADGFTSDGLGTNSVGLVNCAWNCYGNVTASPAKITTAYVITSAVNPIPHPQSWYVAGQTTQSVDNAYLRIASGANYPKFGCYCPTEFGASGPEQHCTKCSAGKALTSGYICVDNPCNSGTISGSIAKGEGGRGTPFACTDLEKGCSYQSPQCNNEICHVYATGDSTVTGVCECNTNNTHKLSTGAADGSDPSTGAEGDSPSHALLSSVGGIPSTTAGQYLSREGRCGFCDIGYAMSIKHTCEENPCNPDPISGLTCSSLSGCVYSASSYSTKLTQTSGEQCTLIPAGAVPASGFFTYGDSGIIPAKGDCNSGTTQKDGPQCRNCIDGYIRAGTGCILDSSGPLSTDFTVKIKGDISNNPNSASFNIEIIGKDEVCSSKPAEEQCKIKIFKRIERDGTTPLCDSRMKVVQGTTTVSANYYGIVLDPQDISFVDNSDNTCNYGSADGATFARDVAKNLGIGKRIHYDICRVGTDQRSSTNCLRKTVDIWRDISDDLYVITGGLNVDGTDSTDKLTTEKLFSSSYPRESSNIQLLNIRGYGGGNYEKDYTSYVALLTSGRTLLINYPTYDTRYWYVKLVDDPGQNKGLYAEADRLAYSSSAAIKLFYKNTANPKSQWLLDGVSTSAVVSKMPADNKNVRISNIFRTRKGTIDADYYLNRNYWFTGDGVGNARVYWHAPVVASNESSIRYADYMTPVEFSPYNVVGVNGWYNNDDAAVFMVYNYGNSYMEVKLFNKEDGVKTATSYTSILSSNLLTRNFYNRALTMDDYSNNRSTGVIRELQVIPTNTNRDTESDNSCADNSSATAAGHQACKIKVCFGTACERTDECVRPYSDDHGPNALRATDSEDTSAGTSFFFGPSINGNKANQYSIYRVYQYAVATGNATDSQSRNMSLFLGDDYYNGTSWEYAHIINFAVENERLSCDCYAGSDSYCTYHRRGYKIALRNDIASGSLNNLGGCGDGVSNQGQGVYLRPNFLGIVFNNRTYFVAGTQCVTQVSIKNNISTVLAFPETSTYTTKDIYGSLNFKGYSNDVDSPYQEMVVAVGPEHHILYYYPKVSNTTKWKKLPTNNLVQYDLERVYGQRGEFWAIGNNKSGGGDKMSVILHFGEVVTTGNRGVNIPTGSYPPLK